MSSRSLAPPVHARKRSTAVKSLTTQRQQSPFSSNFSPVGSPENRRPRSPNINQVISLDDGLLSKPGGKLTRKGLGRNTASKPSHAKDSRSSSINGETQNPQEENRPSGWNEDWVDVATVQQYVCGACHMVGVDLVIHACGTLFCEACFRQRFLAGRSCLSCHRGNEASPAPRDRQSVLNLMMRCPLQCGKAMRLADYASHCRELCSRRCVPCKKCQALLPPGEQARHDLTCEEVTTPCSLCSTEVKRKDLEAHMKDQSLVGTHLSAVCLENYTLKRKVEELEASVADLSLCLGMAFNKGKVEQSVRKSERLLRVAVTMNKGKDVEWLYPRAEQGDAAAARELGRCYAKGRGVTKDQAMAVRWYLTAAQQGLPVAQCDLGLCYKNGEGVEKNLGQAVKWWTKAAELGDSHAQYFLGLCYSVDHGPDAGFEKNEIKSVEWWSRAAKAGHVSAQFDLGVCYQRGRGVEKDVSRALLWFERAAVKGHSEAKKRLEKLQNLQPESVEVLRPSSIGQ
eukprot:gb/GEZN01006314.1/.p1 GENE.gb/GEZN01006314.1/~~gb/GEZN01006314.1/.p1  ORF type:complete len:526 (-),score=53.82 gb/GEZN01006314.1/:102-1637(-)